jgi:hypothetical protein
MAHYIIDLLAISMALVAEIHPSEATSTHDNSQLRFFLPHRQIAYNVV